MKAVIFDHCNSSPAPKEWWDIPEIKAARPGPLGWAEISLQRLDYPKNINLVHWSGAKNGRWYKISETFRVTKR